MDPRTTLEMMVSEILDNDEDGAQESFSMLIGWVLKNHDKILADGFVPSLKEAMFKVNHASEHHP